MSWLQRGRAAVFTYRWLAAGAVVCLGVSFCAGMLAGLHYAIR